MAKNTVPPSDAARVKAQQMRQAQERADKRTRNIIIGVVAAVVVAVIAVVAIVVGNQIAKNARAHDSANTALLGSYEDGGPIVVSSKGVGVADDSVPTLTEYFDYSCHACADIDGFIGRDLSDGALAGDYTLEIQPVTVVGVEYAGPATTASLIVADQAPDHWIEFHHALLAYFGSQYRAGEGRVVSNEEASWKQVKSIALEVGVPQEIVDSFPVNVSDAYLERATNEWREAPIAGREGLGTPEFVKDHSTKIVLSGTDAPSILETIRTGMGLESASAQ
ncbi:DsbA family protein [Actinomyces sp. B33]|uniref:DsbA family protein n=1 Tax=Actinomyces sp. B33 TaxID=2942131 RepID=UPI0023416E73|nr:DsbA family protein [Actinomyces sp. B33]MDC4232227.1 DsbA family protein [Actinomyces sp. B33]